VLGWFDSPVELSLHSLTDVLTQADDRVRAGTYPASRVWPTGFELLDKTLSGGLRSGELVLLGGPQGLGKTTWALQVARNVARSGRSVLFFSYEHDLETLLIRLVAMEAGQLGGIVAPPVSRIRRSFEGTDGRLGGLPDRLQDTEGGVEALEIVREYADRLVLHRSTGTSTGIEDIAAGIAAVRERTGGTPLVVVDYLQKVHGPGVADDDARVTAVTEGLKDLALDHDVPVLAVSAADKGGLGTGKRLRVNHLRGSSALAYEPDTVLMLNNKYDVVARHHLVYSLGNIEQFRNWAVLSVEKNRNGRSGVDLEFQKLFDQCRFETTGRAVSEQLVEERVFVE
jgi:replicative DNA helicase